MILNSISFEDLIRDLHLSRPVNLKVKSRNATSKSKREYRKSRSITNKSYTEDIKKMSNEKNFLSNTDVDDLLTSEFLIDCQSKKMDVHFKSIHLLCSMQEWKDFLNRNSNDRIRIFCPSEDYGTVFFNNSMVKFSISSTSINVKIIGEITFILLFENSLRKEFNFAESFIDWVYSSDGSTVTVPLTEDKTPVSEMYPFLGTEQLHSYYDRYMHSSASILVLLGPPGTGKTSFVRGLLQYTKTSAVVTYDPELLEKDYVFARFIEGSSNVMIIEDADNFLGSRKDGNTVMHKFLNVGDGLVTTRNKKLIFSTNLPSVKEIDSALVRPGRCFDVLSFSYLNKEQAKILAKAMGLELINEKSSYSIADIFHVQNNKPIERKMGFL